MKASIYTTKILLSLDDTDSENTHLSPDYRHLLDMAGNINMGFPCTTPTIHSLVGIVSVMFKVGTYTIPVEFYSGRRLLRSEKVTITVFVDAAGSRDGKIAGREDAA